MPNELSQGDPNSPPLPQYQRGSILRKQNSEKFQVVLKSVYTGKQKCFSEVLKTKVAIYAEYRKIEGGTLWRKVYKKSHNAEKTERGTI